MSLLSGEPVQRNYSNKQFSLVKDDPLVIVWNTKLLVYVAWFVGRPDLPAKAESICHGRKADKGIQLR